MTISPKDERVRRAHHHQRRGRSLCDQVPASHARSRRARREVRQRRLSQGPGRLGLFGDNLLVPGATYTHVPAAAAPAPQGANRIPPPRGLFVCMCGFNPFLLCGVSQLSQSKPLLLSFVDYEWTRGPWRSHRRICTRARCTEDSLPRARSFWS